MKNDSQQPSRTSTGLTLVELLFAMTIVTILSAGLVVFMIDVSRGVFWGVEKAQISEDVRSFTMRIAAEARSANDFLIYETFQPEDRNQGTDRRGPDQSGDCLVLANTEFYPDAASPTHYTRIIVYYRLPEGADGIGPVHRFEWEAENPTEYHQATDSSGQIINTFESVLAAVAPNADENNPVVIELSRGVANNRLFTNFRDNTVVINGEILHGHQVKEVTNTYNLSISPRG